MKSKWVILGLVSASLLACSGANSPAARQATQNAGITASYRAGSDVILLYQESSTTQNMLQAEANRVCAKGGKRAGAPREMSVGGARNIPGVDAKMTYSCI